MTTLCNAVPLEKQGGRPRSPKRLCCGRGRAKAFSVFGARRDRPTHKSPRAPLGSALRLATYFQREDSSRGPPSSWQWWTPPPRLRPPPAASRPRGGSCPWSCREEWQWLPPATAISSIGAAPAKRRARLRPARRRSPRPTSCRRTGARSIWVTINRSVFAFGIGFEVTATTPSVPLGYGYRGQHNITGRASLS